MSRMLRSLLAGLCLFAPEVCSAPAASGGDAGDARDGAVDQLRKRIGGISTAADARSLDESATRLGTQFSEVVWSAEPLDRGARAAIADWALDLEQVERSRWAWWLLLTAHDLGWSGVGVQGRLVELIFADERAREDLPVPTEIRQTEIERVMRAATEVTGAPLHRAQLVADFAGGLLRSASLPRQLIGAAVLTEVLRSGKVTSRLVLDRLCSRIGAAQRDLLAIRLRAAAAIGSADRLDWIVGGSESLRLLAVDASGESAGDTAALTAAIFGLANSQSVEDRVAVARYLSRTPLGCSAAVLRTLAEDANSAVRAQTLESLGARKCRSSDARALVARGLRDASGHVRLLAIQATGSVLVGAREVSVALRDAVSDPDEYCRCAALDVLLRWRVLDPWSIAALVSELGAGSEDSVRDLVGVLHQEASQLHGVLTSRLVELIPSADDRATAGIVVALDALGFRGHLELTTERIAALEKNSHGSTAFKRISR